ncbi:MAG TPA: hypothetical protein VMV43_00950 [Candidatus Nanopelagicaceae bacterium]|nr:hypothetical protein [Candidatus Nanopelagicaceae bacterium]
MSRGDLIWLRTIIGYMVFCTCFLGFWFCFYFLINDPPRLYLFRSWIVGPVRASYVLYALNFVGSWSCVGCSCFGSFVLLLANQFFGVNDFAFIAVYC